MLGRMLALRAVLGTRILSNALKGLASPHSWHENVTAPSSPSSSSSFSSQTREPENNDRRRAASTEAKEESKDLSPDDPANWTGFAGMRGEERLYWVKDIGEPVSMEEILSGEIELPEDFRVETHLGIPNLVERPDLVDRYLSDSGKARSELMKERLEKVRKENARTKRDTGSPEIQIALWTEKIKMMTENHINEHSKDKHSKRGLYTWISRRRRMMKYLYRKDYERYVKIKEKLGLRDVH